MDLKAIRAAVAATAAGNGATGYARTPTGAVRFPAFVVRPAEVTYTRRMSGAGKVALVGTISVNATGVGTEIADATLDDLVSTLPTHVAAAATADIREVTVLSATNWRAETVTVADSEIQLLSADLIITVTTT